MRKSEYDFFVKGLLGILTEAGIVVSDNKLPKRIQKLATVLSTGDFDPEDPIELKVVFEEALNCTMNTLSSTQIVDVADRILDTVLQQIKISTFRDNIFAFAKNYLHSRGLEREEAKVSDRLIRKYGPFKPTRRDEPPKYQPELVNFVKFIRRNNGQPESCVDFNIFKGWYEKFLVKYPEVDDVVGTKFQDFYNEMKDTMNDLVYVARNI